MFRHSLGRPRLSDGGTITAELYKTVRAGELAKLGDAGTRLGEAAELLDALVLAPEFVEFLTIPGYTHLD